MSTGLLEAATVQAVQVADQPRLTNSQMVGAAAPTATLDAAQQGHGLVDKDVKQ
jgi:hypothetical protein